VTFALTVLSRFRAEKPLPLLGVLPRRRMAQELVRSLSNRPSSCWLAGRISWNGSGVGFAHLLHLFSHGSGPISGTKWEFVSQFWVLRDLWHFNGRAEREMG
jgi:hypothetical protein